MSGVYLQDDAENDLDRQAHRIRVLFARLIERINGDGARCWEHVYQISDLTEEVQRLKGQLRNSLPIGYPDNASEEAISALEVMLDSDLRKAREELLRERSKNWDLEYQCRDLREEVWRLTMHLAHSIAISDWEESPVVHRTAREKALEEKVKGLERRVKELDDKARNRDVRIGHAEGTGRARSRSM